MITLLPDFPDSVIAVQCSGHVTRDDYESVLIPAVNRTLAQHDKVRLYYDVSEEFEGIDPSAVWDDIKVGVEHLPHWQRMAVVTDIGWIGHSIKAFGFLMPGKIRIFPVAERQAAREWVLADIG